MKRKIPFTMLLVIFAVFLVMAMTFTLQTAPTMKKDAAITSSAVIGQIDQVAQQVIAEGTTLFVATTPAGIGSGVTVLTGKDSLAYKDQGQTLYVIVSSFSGHSIGTVPAAIIAPTPVIHANYITATLSTAVIFKC